MIPEERVELLRHVRVVRDIAPAARHAVRGMSALVDAAIAYAIEGRPVFPCESKQPATVHGFKDATTNVGRIRRWWTTHPGHWIGSPTAGHLVVDLDVTDGVDTWAAWPAIAEPHGWEVDDTRLAATPSGGLHIWYRSDDPHVRNTAGRLAPHIDTRAAGGYCIVPPSPGYEWLNPSTAIAVAPRWLLELCACPPPSPIEAHVSRPPRSTPGPCEGLVATVASAPEGERNSRLNWAAHQIGVRRRAGRLTDADAVAVLDQLDAVAMGRGLPRPEVARTIRSGYGAGVAGR